MGEGMKYALITGGTRGIGLATARLFFREGYAVVATYAENERDAERARAENPGIMFVKADVANEADVRRVMELLPSLDVLVNNAAISLLSQVQDTTWEQWNKMMSVNAGGVFLCCKYAVRKFLAQEGGSIVNVASVWGETGGSCESAYSASKGAVIAFTKALAKELAPSNIRVNAVSPGVIETPMNAWMSEEERNALKEEIPMGRMGESSEVAQCIYDISRQTYVTGQILGVNGGFLV